MRLKERFDTWVQGMVNEAVKRHMPDRETVIINAISGIDRKDLAWHVDTPDFRKNVAQFVKEELEDDIDTSEIARKIAETMDAEDVAHYMDAEDVANYIDVDSDTIAEKVAAEIDVASCIDYDQLAEKLVEKLKEAWA
jgi:hypothetical protein